MNRRSKGENIVELTQNGLPSTWFVFTKEISISVSIVRTWYPPRDFSYSSPDLLVCF